MHNRELIVLSCAIASMMVLVAFVGLVTVTPTHAQETFSIVGTWDNDNPTITDIYTIYPPTTPGGTSGAAQDVHSGVTSPGTWEQATGTKFGHPYEYIWYWTFGPPAGNFIDYIHVIDNDHVSYINNYGNTGSNSRVNTAPTAKITHDGRNVAGEMISCSASQSTDPDDAFSTLTFAWDITGPGGRSDVVSYNKGSTATSPDIAWVPQVPGDYVVTLTVTDPSGQSNSDTVTIHVSPAVAARVWLAETAVENQYVLHWYITNDGSQPASITMQTLIHGADASLPDYIFRLAISQNLHVSVINGDSHDYTYVLKASKHEARAVRAWITSFESTLVVKNGAYTYSGSTYDQEPIGWLKYYGKWQTIP